MNLTVHSVESPQAEELYITATPAAAGAADGREMFEGIAAVLREKGASICQERVFAPAAQQAALRQARAKAYGELADAVEPTWLAVQDAQGRMPGVQVYAVRTASKPRLIAAGDARGRVFEMNGCRWLTATGLSAPKAGDAGAQARATFEKAESLLKEAGGDLKCVARTWIFMDDVLTWYGDLNKVRNQFFVERGLLGPGADGRLPASTGIGVSPADGSRCVIDLFAVMGPEGCVRRHEAAGKQRSAYEYGSAFARAVTAVTPGGKTIFISGTAAIDPVGATCFLNDIPGQVKMTIENVIAVLRQLSAGPEDVVQAMAYCASPAVEEHFRKRWADEVRWPWVTMIGDVCRGDLLFEVEVTAKGH